MIISGYSATATRPPTLAGVPIRVWGSPLGYGAETGPSVIGTDLESAVSPGRLCTEASGCLVAPAVFKTDVVEYLDQAGSIPVRLRQSPR